MKRELIDILVNREGYNRQRAILAAIEIEKLDKNLFPLLKSWIDDPDNMQEFVSHNISLLELKEKKNMNYIGALLTMDWLIKEPDVAGPIVESFCSSRM